MKNAFYLVPLVCMSLILGTACSSDDPVEPVVVTDPVRYLFDGEWALQKTIFQWGDEEPEVIDFAAKQKVSTISFTAPNKVTYKVYVADTEDYEWDYFVGTYHVEGSVLKMVMGPDAAEAPTLIFNGVDLKDDILTLSGDGAQDLSGADRTFILKKIK